jgi:tRNA pseudouridine55 synthase
LDLIYVILVFINLKLMNLEPKELEKFIQYDPEGKPNGVIPVYKPRGITSHRVVEIIRRTLKTKKVGHAGTLDPFAEGLLIILVGKSTKLSDQFLEKDKTYEATMLLGVGTNSGDIEGEIIGVEDNLNLTLDEISEQVLSFIPEYNQYVPVFSSVKVKGFKLRELARKADKFETIELDNNKEINFYKNGELFHNLVLPQKLVKIYAVDDVRMDAVALEDINNDYSFKDKVMDYSHLKNANFLKVTFNVSVSKGTYIRQLAIDIANKLNTFGVLIELKRTEIGELSVKNSVPLLMP